jgi:hypothetical protein
MAKSTQGGLVVPDDVAERLDGTTSDPATRDADVTAAEVPPDPTAAVHQSDAGEEGYPFPPQGDVDRGLLSDRKRKGETPGPIEIEDWVKLADTDDVPDGLVGHTAAVISKTVDDENETFKVRTRDEHNAELILERDSFAEVFRGGRGLRAG